MGLYGALSEYDPADVAQTLTDVKVEVDRLPQRHSDLWDLFKTIKNKSDEEAYERLLGDEDLRSEFYNRLSDYANTLGIALSTQHFLDTTEDSTLARYKGDLLRFQKLRKAVKLRYAEAVNYARDYEPKIKKLLDTHIQAHSVYQLNEPVNIFDDQAFSEVKESQGVYGDQSPEARADTIAHAVKRAITEHLDEDPAFYEKFSKLIQLAIDDFRAQRISALEYLKQAADLRDRVVTRKHDDLPPVLDGREDAQAYYGVAASYFESSIAAEVALAVDAVFDRHWKVQFWDDTMAQNAVKNDLDDFLFDVVKGQHGVTLDLLTMDEFLERTLQVARHRRRS
jgi:type I restriction enzyme R subunit